MVSSAASARSRPSRSSAPQATALGEYGLDKPAATIQLGSGSSQATLLLGKSAGEGVVYAKDQSRPAIITIESTLADDVSKDPANTGKRISSTAAPSTRRGSR